MIDEYWVYIEPQYYVWDAVGDGRTCILLIM